MANPTAYDQEPVNKKGMINRMHPIWIENLRCAHEGVIFVNPEGLIVFTNIAATQMLGRSSSHLTGCRFTEFFSSKRSSLTTVFDPCQAEFDAKAKHQTGSEFPIRLRSVPIFENEIDTGRLVYLEDRSEHQRSQKLIDLLAQASEEVGSSLEYETTQQRAVSLFVPLVADWAALLSITDSGLLRLAAVDHCDVGDREKMVLYFKGQATAFSEALNLDHAIRTGEPTRTCLMGARWPEFLQDSEIVCFPLEERHEVTGLLCLGANKTSRVLSDDLPLVEQLTERVAVALENARLYQHAVNVERQLVAAESTAEDASRAKTTFLATMSHEIRVPVSSILGFSELLLTQTSQTPEQIRWAERIRDNGDHLLRLIDDILNISKVESGKIELEMKEESFSKLLLNIRSIHHPRALAKGLDLRFTFVTPVPETFRTDPTRLSQILSNLIGNAIKFTDRGHVDVSLRFEKKAKYLLIEVADTGPGLTPDQTTKLFSAFTQAHVSHTRRFGGTGLGLSLSRQLARLFGGDVELLDSQPNKGTRFQIALPLTLANDSEMFSDLEAAASAIRTVKADADTEEQKVLQGLKILLVDDSQDNRFLTSRLLKVAGAEVDLACDGFEAVSKALAEDYAVVLMDVQMPRMDGIQATIELRKQGYKQPVIALTACALQEERNMCLAAGCDAHLLKPVNRDEVLSMILQLAERQKVNRNCSLEMAH